MVLKSPIWFAGQGTGTHLCFFMNMSSETWVLKFLQIFKFIKLFLCTEKGNKGETYSPFSQAPEWWTGYNVQLHFLGSKLTLEPSCSPKSTQKAVYGDKWLDSICPEWYEDSCTGLEDRRGSFYSMILNHFWSLKDPEIGKVKSASNSGAVIIGSTFEMSEWNLIPIEETTCNSGLKCRLSFELLNFAGQGFLEIKMINPPFFPGHLPDV